MLTIDEQHEKSRIKWTHLSFEDFLEALCRLACLKAYPTDKEIEDYGAQDAPRYLHALEMDDPPEYERLQRMHGAQWGRPSDRQPVHRSVEHLCHYLTWRVQGGKEGGAVAAGDYSVTDLQVKAFLFARVGAG